MNSHQVFNDSFEATWKDFDGVFRKKLLEKISQLGSLHRLSCGHEEINAEYGRRFYEALEDAMTAGQFVSKWKKALAVPMPKSFDELAEIFRIHAVYPLHAFYLLLVYVHEHPFRGFFSGRDVPLPFNTLTLKFQQLLSDPLPTGVDYELDMIRPDRCPGLAFDPAPSPAYDPGAGVLLKPKPQPHPQHHWHDLVWVWHFGVADDAGTTSIG